VTTTVNRRSGTEPVRAESARDLRLLLSLVFAPVFLIMAGLLAWWAADAGPDGRSVLALVAGLCVVLFVVASVDAAVLLRRARHQPAGTDQADTPAPGDRERMERPHEKV
jgi:cation transporter-like permease